MSPTHIKHHNIRSDFDRLKTLDDGKGGGHGALNGGVYIAKSKSLAPAPTMVPRMLMKRNGLGKRDGLRCVEKRFKPRDVFTLGHNEIKHLRELEHPNICRFIDAFIRRSTKLNVPHEASLYMELCDLGSVGDLIEWCEKRASRPRIAEAFVWHVLHSLLKALAYIHFGVADRSVEPKRDWRVLLHRDIKPHNIFIRSRGHDDGLYPAIVLGDFGISLEESRRDPEWGSDEWPAGTVVWQPPELPLHHVKGKGDLWSVGAVVLNLCRFEGPPLEKPPRGVPMDRWVYNPAARKPKNVGSHYSRTLNEVHAHTLKLSHHHRPTSLGVLVDLKSRWEAAKVVFQRLPEWMFP